MLFRALRWSVANKIIGVDLNPARENLGKHFGMTHFINPKDVDNVVEADY